jgi:hypothetical protein
MIRYGAVANKMRPMNSDEMLIYRLKLLLIMAKAKIQGYPMGNHRKAAIIENCRIVFKESLSRSFKILASLSSVSSVSDDEAPCDGATLLDHLFLQRTQLLAVMMSSLSRGPSGGRFRNKAVALNIDQICAYLSNRSQFGIVNFLKVA